MDLDEKGYILLSNVLKEKEIEFGLSCLEDGVVDYTIMKQFIDQVFFKEIQKRVAELPDPIYVKYRFSNNNNSTDASTFHGDIYNHTRSELLPIYSCLCYFDNAKLEVIPGSHKYNNNGWSISSYNKKKILNVNRGDILIFHSNMHHRGIQFNTQKNRRLLQVFEVFPDKSTYNEHSSKLVIVQTSNNIAVKNVISPLMYQAAKIPFIIDTITFFHYILMYNDVHYKMGMMDLEPWNKKDYYITYETTRRVYMDELKKDELNINVICDRNAKTIQPSRFYLYCYIVYWIVSFIVLYLLVKLWNRKIAPNQKNKFQSKRLSKRKYKYKYVY
jgi:hypothetical protein